MQRADDRDEGAPAARSGSAEHQERESAQRDEAGGGLHYQQARRSPGEAATNAAGATAGTRSGMTRNVADPDQQQRAEDHGGPHPDDESWLQDQGYPKLGKSAQSRVTQVEHGPYAGGSQQGDTKRREDRRSSS